MDRLPDVALTIGEEHVFSIGDDTIRVRNMGSGHTWNDVIVYFENWKILMTGDLVFDRWHPAVLKPDGANVSKWIDNLNFMINNYDAETVIPGHGSVSQQRFLGRDGVCRGVGGGCEGASGDVGERPGGVGFAEGGDRGGCGFGGGDASGLRCVVW